MVLLISKNILPESDSVKNVLFQKALLHYFILLHYYVILHKTILIITGTFLPTWKADLII